MAKIDLSLISALEFIILGIENGKYQAAINIAQEVLDGLTAHKKTNNQMQPAPNSGSEDEIASAIQEASPEQLLQLKKANNQFKLDMKKLGINLKRLVYADKASARKRQETLKDKTPEILAYLLTVGFFGMLVALFVCDIPEANKLVVNSLISILGTVWIAAMAYFHGTSASSARKDIAIQGKK